MRARAGGQRIAVARVAEAFLVGREAEQRA